MGGDNQAGGLGQAARHPGMPCCYSMPVPVCGPGYSELRASLFVMPDCIAGVPVGPLCGILPWLVTSLCIGCRFSERHGMHSSQNETHHALCCALWSPQTSCRGCTRNDVACAWGLRDMRWATWHAQQPAPARACRFYAGEMVMSMLALTAALYGVAAAHKWSFSVFLGLQGALPWRSPTLLFPHPQA